MCGLVGMAGRIYGSEKKAFRILHYLDALRGEHSTGLATISEHNNHVKMYKAVGGPQKLWDAYPNDFDEKDHELKDWSAKVYIGHNRFATVGAKTAANAHPFQHGNIVGAHNGTLTKGWLDQLEGSEKFEVDSEAIFYSINKKGLADTIATMHGAWALVYFDKADQTVNFIRNKERSLYYAWSKDGKTLFWASESWMLKIATSKANIDIDEPAMFTQDLHYELSIPGKEPIKPANLVYYEEKLTGFQPPVMSYTGRQTWWADQEWWDEHLNMGAEKRIVTTNKDENKNNVIQLPPAKRVKHMKDELVDDYTTARKLLHQDVILTFYGESTSHQQHVGTYLIATCEGLPDTYEIRVFGEHHINWPEWSKMDSRWRARIVGITNKWDDKISKFVRFLSVSLPSMERVPDAPEQPKKEEEKADDGKPRPSGVPSAPNTGTSTKRKQHKEAAEIILESQLVWDVHRTYSGYKGERISFGEYIKAVNQGCVWCGETPTPIEADTTVFVQPGRLICTICANTGHALQYYRGA